MTAPSCAISPAQTRVLLALIRCWQRDGRATVRGVGAEAGLTSAATVHCHLRQLDALGLVSGVRDGTQGALRPAVLPVAVLDGAA